MPGKRDSSQWRAAIALSSMAMVGCLGRSVTDLPDLSIPTTSLGAVIGTPPNAIIPVGGNVQLNATGVAFDGSSIATLDSVTYIWATLTDTLRLRLSSTGVATGLVSTGTAGIPVNVIGFKGDGIRGDQVMIQVTPTVLAGPLTLSVQPTAPDSAKLASGTTKSIVPVLRNPTTGASVTVPFLKLAINAQDSARMDVFRAQVKYFPKPLTNQFDYLTVTNYKSSNNLAANQISALSSEGTAWIYAMVNAYGTMLRDSVLYTLSYPYLQTITTVKINLAVVNIFAGQILRLASGATITFQNGVAATDPLLVAYTFDVPAAATATSPPSSTGGASGNVTPLVGGQTSKRLFVTPGTYHWTMTPTGGPTPWPGQVSSGTIIIH